MKFGENGCFRLCVQLLGECSELIRFWATLAKFWPSSSHNMTVNGGFRPLSEKYHDLFQTWCSDWLEGSSQNILFLATWA